MMPTPPPRSAINGDCGRDGMDEEEALRVGDGRRAASAWRWGKRGQLQGHWKEKMDGRAAWMARKGWTVQARSGPLAKRSERRENGIGKGLEKWSCTPKKHQVHVLKHGLRTAFIVFVLLWQICQKIQ